MAPRSSVWSGLRFFIVRVTALARAAGLISAQRIFLIGTGANVNGFVNRYEPWTHGINIVAAPAARRSDGSAEGRRTDPACPNPAEGAARTPS